MRVSLGRWLLATGAVLGGAVALAILAGRGEGPGPLLAGIAFAVPLCSLGEWLVHGVLYHGRLPGLGVVRRIHHHGHHFALFPPTRYVQRGRFEFMRVRAPLTPFRMADSAFDNRVTKWSQVALHLGAGVPLVLAPAWALTGSRTFFAAAAGTLAVISWLLAHVHGAIHTPKQRWIERQAWFQWLDHHHYIHHVDPTANINFLLPLCDVLYGTHRSALSDAELARWPAFEQAKAGITGGAPGGRRSAAAGATSGATRG
jgi:hypothetical protein